MSNNPAVPTLNAATPRSMVARPKDQKRRTKTGCLTCRKRRIKVSEFDFFALEHFPVVPVRARACLRCHVVVEMRSKPRWSTYGHVPHTSGYIDLTMTRL
jgi:hypothetical protein